MSGILYVVATPIGNLEDVTFRAVKVLKGVNLVLCEDTRVTRKLLDHFDIQVDTLSYHQQSSISKKQEILNLLLMGKNIALVSDAGTPGISDPGNELIDFIESLRVENGIKIVPVPGVSSVTAALSICGFNVSNFMFIGFWPKKKSKRLVEKIKLLSCPVVFLESPYRILKTLDLLVNEFGEGKRIFVGQELTKIHERALRGSIIKVKAELEKEKDKLGRVKGEIVCILE